MASISDRPDVEVVDGCALHRRGTGAPIVCLPAFADSVRSWQPLIPALSDRSDVVVVEIPSLNRPGRLPVDPTVTEIANLIAGIVQQAFTRPVTFVGHSLGSALAVRAAEQLDGQCHGVVSIEGNLVADDAYLTGQAVNHDEPDEFKRSLATQVARLASAGKAPASFAEAVRAADAPTMWALGHDIAQQSSDDRFGHELLQLTCPTLYLWSEATTPRATQTFLQAHAVPNHELGIAHHWPWTIDPATVAALIAEV
jgi:pimeloyl-ACP methyl ester carboxylesterase